MYVKTGELRLERTRQLGDDRELSSTGLEGCDYLAIEETRIGANPDLTHRRRDFGQAGRQQVYSSVTRVHVAGAEFPVPEISRLGLEADPGMIGRTAVFVRIVADAGLLLMPVQGQHRGVQVEDDAPPRLGALPQFRQQAVVPSTQVGQSANRQPAQEPPQGDGIGISWPPRESLENTIPAQEIGGVEPTEPKNGRVQKRQPHL